MFTYILWILIAGILIFIFDRLLGGIIASLVLVGAIFLSVFMLDSFTSVPIRDFLTLNWYDETVEDPVGTSKKVVDKTVDGGKKVADEVNKAGDRLNVKYGTADSKEWSLEEEDEGTREDNLHVEEIEIQGGEYKDTEEGYYDNLDKEDGEKEAVSEKDEKKKGKKDSEEGNVIFIKYGDVGKELNGKLKDLTSKDKEIIKGMTSIYKTKIRGTDIIVWNNAENGEDGVYVEY